VCQHADRLKDPEARAALIWILGEYCGIIEKVDVVIDPFLDTFADEAPLVQLQLISTVVKVYLEKREEMSDMLQFVLTEATRDSVLPDVRNRALIYWRMLSMSPEVTKEFVAFRKNQVEHAGQSYAPAVLRELMTNVGLVAGVLRVLPLTFVARAAAATADSAFDEGAREWRPVQVTGGAGAALYSDWSSKGYFVQIVNTGERPLTGLAVEVGANGAGFEIESAIAFPDSLGPTETCEVMIGYSFNPSAAQTGASACRFGVALKASECVVSYTETIDARRITARARAMKKREFLEFFGSHPGVAVFELHGVEVASRDALRERNISVVARKLDEVCLSFLLAADAEFVCDIEVRGGSIRGCVKGDPSLFGLLRETAQHLFCRD